MTIGIYGIFDKKTDECLYVGQTLDVESRWKQHLKLLKSKKHKRQDFVEWYHNDNNSDLIDFRVLEECKSSELNNLEIKWFNSLLPKYYGKKPSNKETWEHSDETKNKISESLRKRYNSDFSAEKINKIIEYANDKNTTINQASKLLRISKSVLKKFLFEENIKWEIDRSKKIKNKDQQILHWYLNEKLSTREISKKLDVSQPAIINILKRLKKTDTRFNQIRERENRKKITRTKESNEKLSNSLKNLENISCRYCFNKFSPISIKRHENSCKTWPYCLCGNRLSKRSAKKCKKCLKSS